MSQTHQGKTFEQLLEMVMRVDSAGPKYMKKVLSSEFRANNSSQHTVLHLECGHERVMDYGIRAQVARCWECPKLDEPCETCSSEREITVRGSESDHTERIPCPDCRPRRKQ